MNKAIKLTLLFLGILIAIPNIHAQDKKWFVGGEYSLPQTYYRSKSTSLAGIYGGYRLNSYLSAELGGRMGYMDYNLPISHSLYYMIKDVKLLVSNVDYKEVSARLNFDALNFFLKKETPFSVEVSPKLGMAFTQSNLSVITGSEAYRMKNNPKSRMLAGMNLQLSYRILDMVKLGVYGGITSVSGGSMDLFEDKHPNLILDKGVSVSVAFGGPKRRAVSSDKQVVPVVEEPIHPQQDGQDLEDFPEVFFFQEHTAEILQTEFQKLKVLQVFLNQNPKRKVTLTGYSDSEPNTALALQRVEAVRDWLVEHGANSKQIVLAINPKENTDVPRVEITKIR